MQFTVTVEKAMFKCIYRNVREKNLFIHCKDANCCLQYDDALKVEHKKLNSCLRQDKNICLSARNMSGDRFHMSFCCFCCFRFGSGFHGRGKKRLVSKRGKK